MSLIFSSLLFSGLIFSHVLKMILAAALAKASCFPVLSPFLLVASSTGTEHISMLSPNCMDELSRFLPPHLSYPPLTLKP